MDASIEFTGHVQARVHVEYQKERKDCNPITQQNKRELGSIQNETIRT
jgi:hypothetical protein